MGYKDDELTPEQRAELYGSLRQRFEAASDDSDVREADANTRKADMLGGILGGVSQILGAESVSRGNRAQDTSWTKDVGNIARNTAAQAREGRKDRMGKVLEGDRLDQVEKDRAWQGEQQGQTRTDWAQTAKNRERQDRLNADTDETTAREKDPGSQESSVTRALAKKLMPSGDFEGMSAFQLQGSLPILKDMYSAEQSRILRLEGMQERKDAKDAAKTEAHNKQVETDVQKLGDALGNAQEIQASIGSVEDALGFPLESYEGEGKVKGRDKKLDLPGVSLPGVGRVTAYDKDARVLDSKIGKIFNTVLKDRSGAAVTSPELERLRIEFANGKYSTEDEMLGALRDYKKAANDAMKNVEARYRPEVIDTYKGRGGTTSRPSQPEPTSAGKVPGKVKMFDENGKAFQVPEANVEVARKKGWKIAE